MRWKTNEPNIGDTKVIRRFAIFPVRMSDESVLWLERYTATYEFRRVVKYSSYSVYVALGWACIKKEAKE